MTFLTFLFNCILSTHCICEIVVLVLRDRWDDNNVGHNFSMLHWYGCGMVGIHDSMTMTVLERVSQDKIRTTYVCSLTLGGQ